MEKIEYIKYIEPNLPNPETIQNSFEYWKSIEKLDWNTQVRNLWLEWTVKVSSTDKDLLYLNDSIETSWSVSKTLIWNTLSLSIDTNNLFWDWSDWEYIRTWNTLFWEANKTVYNFTNFTYYWNGTDTMICWDRDTPIIINCTWDFTLSNAIIDFSWRFISTAESIVINYWWQTYNLKWTRWDFWTWWFWWNWYYCSNYPINNPVDWQAPNWFIWWNWWNWNWAWACSCWFQVNSTWWTWWQTYWANWQRWWWYASWWGWWAWWEWGKWWVPLIINVKWNLDLWYVVKLNWEKWEDWWDWWRWRWWYESWCWYSYWHWWDWWDWADWWNWWWLYLNYWWTLTFSPSNLEYNWWARWNWWTWWLYFENSEIIDWANWNPWEVWQPWTYSVKKIIDAI